MGIPENIAVYIKDTFKINQFIETGTYMGGTAVWASQHFKNVYTIEFSESLYRNVSQKFKHIDNINFIFGDSREALKSLSNTFVEPALFWLDAHWCSGESYGESDQCPLIEELKIINNSLVNNFILIDDARLFLAPPPKPNDIKYYPNIQDIISCLKNQYILVYEDVIFIVPNVYKKVFNEFMQIVSTKSWIEYGEKAKKQEELEKRSKIKKTRNLVAKILRIWGLK